MKNLFFSLKNQLTKKDVLLFWALFLLGSIVRVALFGELPGGLNQDEAFAGYEAYSLLHYGKDSAGYAFPCYFVSWGSGMNVLESYLAIPFIGLFGLSVATIRIPQLLVGILSLPTLYCLLKELFTKRTALIGMGFLAICPWHIMLSRWGLESNLAPGFLLFGFYFLVKGLKVNKFLALSALFYGASLYAYATTWAVVPLTLIGVGIYLFIKGYKISFKWAGISVAILFVLALPLLLFYLVNQGLIPEIKTAFFSAPKLVFMRSSEIDVNNLIDPQAYEKVFNLILKQDDGLIWNTTETFGLFYSWTLPLAAVGMLSVLCWIFSAKKEANEGRVLLFIGLLCAFLVCVMISGLNVNKANILHTYTLIFIVVGIEQVVDFFKSNKALKYGIIGCLAISFCWFSSYYFGAYNQEISDDFKQGLGEAVSYVNTLDANEVYVDPSIYHSQILFYDQTPLPEYLETVSYKNYPSAYLQAAGFSKYNFIVDYATLDAGAVYISPLQNKSFFAENGFIVQEFDRYIVAYI